MSIIIWLQTIICNGYASLESIIRIIILSNLFIPKVKKSKRTKPLLILANGPSLNEDIERYKAELDKYDLMCVNHFPTTSYYEYLQPEFFITAVPELWIDNVDKIYHDQRNALLLSLKDKTTWKNELFLPFQALKNDSWKNALTFNQNISIQKFNTTPVEGFRLFRHFCFRRNLGMPRPHNVLIPALMMGINSGYKEIYLLGVDHSWLNQISVTEKNEVLINQKHFYDEKTATGKPMDKLGKGKRNLAEVLHKFMHAFNGYFVIKDYAHSEGVAIYNATKGSFIDAFERKALV